MTEASPKTVVRVSDVMSTSMITIDGLATIQQAIDKMNEARVSSLLVERRHEDDEFGMLVVSDIAKQVIAPDRARERVYVYECMSKPILTVAQEMDIKYATRLLANFGLSRAVVIDHDRVPVGIVTLRDMVLRHSN